MYQLLTDTQAKPRLRVNVVQGDINILCIICHKLYLGIFTPRLSSTMVCFSGVITSFEIMNTHPSNLLAFSDVQETFGICLSRLIKVFKFLVKNIIENFRANMILALRVSVILALRVILVLTVNTEIFTWFF